MKLPRLLAASLIATFVSTVAHATVENLIANADGDLTANRSAAVVAQAMFPVLPQLGDSGISVKTNVTLDRAAALLTVSVSSSGAALAKGEEKIHQLFKCEVFSLTLESTGLFVAKAHETADLQNGTRRDNVLRADCKDQSGASKKLVISYDTDSYSVLMNDDTLKTANPRFDLVIGPLRKK